MLFIFKSKSFSNHWNIKLITNAMINRKLNYTDQSISDDDEVIYLGSLKFHNWFFDPLYSH